MKTIELIKAEDYESKYFYDLDLIIDGTAMTLRNTLELLRIKSFSIKTEIDIGGSCINYKFNISYKTYSSEDLYLDIDCDKFRVPLERYIDKSFEFRPIKSSIEMSSNRLGIYFNFLLDNIDHLPDNRKDWKFIDLGHCVKSLGTYLKPK